VKAFSAPTGHHPDPRVGDHDIHRAEARCAAGHGGPQSGSVTNVGLGRNNAAAESLDFSYGPGKSAGVASG
jgi:hypothetical protein